MKEKNILTIDLDYIQNKKTFLDVLSLFNLFVKDNKPIIFCNAHHEAFEFIDKNSNLYNLDHHHDLGYDPISFQEAHRKKYREGNWIYGLIIEKIINSYTWIKNYDSKLDVAYINDNLRNFKKLKISTDLNLLFNIKFEKLIVCESPEYEKEMSFYFDILKSISYTFNEQNSYIKESENRFNWINNNE